MNKFFIFLIYIVFLSNCTYNKVSQHHGVRYLENKQENLIVSTSNRNDIISLLGPPSVESIFDNTLLIYIERVKTKKPLIKLGSDKITVNNVLLLEIDNKGLLSKKDFFDISKMNEIKFSQMTTGVKNQKKTFLYSFLSSMRQKMNDPLGKRKKP
tara:strand:+ start:83 stop:547 length:465 start_codon:yes stop_codon:yes gene_type:complete